MTLSVINPVIVIDGLEKVCPPRYPPIINCNGKFAVLMAFYSTVIFGAVVKKINLVSKVVAEMTSFRNNTEKLEKFKVIMKIIYIISAKA